MYVPSTPSYCVSMSEWQLTKFGLIHYKFILRQNNFLKQDSEKKKMRQKHDVYLISGEMHVNSFRKCFISMD